MTRALVDSVFESPPFEGTPAPKMGLESRPSGADHRIVSVSGVPSVGGQTVYPGLSGLRDATVRLDVAASNLANLQSAGFSPSRVVSGTLPGGGVESIVIRDDATEGVDLVTELVSMMMARLAFSANLAALTQTFETQRSVLDIVG